MVKKADALLGTLHFCVWIGVEILVPYAMSHSPSRQAYGLLTAWWATLYLGRLAGIRLAAVPVVAALVLVAVSLDVTLSLRLLYRDALSVLSIDFLLVYLGRTVLIASPIGLNVFINNVEGRLRRSKSEAPADT